MHYSSDDTHIGTRLMSADSHNLSLDAARFGRQTSGSQLSPSSALGRTQLHRDHSAPHDLSRQASGSIVRSISHSGSRHGPTALNIPLSTQQPSVMLSAAGERVRAYSDSANAQEAADATRRSYQDSHHLVDAKPGLEPQKEVDEYTPVSSQEQRRQAATTVQPLPRAEDVCLIAFVNVNSGGKTGARIAEVMKQELGAERVFNLGEKNPTKESAAHHHTRGTDHLQLPTPPPPHACLLFPCL